jgi:hypothetical protein
MSIPTGRKRPGRDEREDIGDGDGDGDGHGDGPDGPQSEAKTIDPASAPAPAPLELLDTYPVLSPDYSARSDRPAIAKLLTQWLPKVLCGLICAYSVPAFGWEEIRKHNHSRSAWYVLALCTGPSAVLTVLR